MLGERWVVEENPISEAARVQGVRLRDLRMAADVTKAHLMTVLHFGSSQTYDLYERGTSTIPFKRVNDWARAFRVSPRAFAEVLVGSLPAEAAIGSIIRDRLHGIVPEDQIANLIHDHGRAPIEDQIAIAEHALRQTQGRIDEARPHRSPRSA